VRPRYLGVGDGTRRTTFPRATHTCLSMLLHRRRRSEVKDAVNEEDSKRDHGGRGGFGRACKNAEVPWLSLINT